MRVWGQLLCRKSSACCERVCGSGEERIKEREKLQVVRERERGGQDSSATVCSPALFFAAVATALSTHLPIYKFLRNSKFPTSKRKQDADSFPPSFFRLLSLFLSGSANSEPVSPSLRCVCLQTL